MSTTTEIQLDPPITVDTPRGKGEAYFKTQYGPDSYTIWGVFLRDSGDFWEFRAPFVKLFWNESMGTGRRPDAGPIAGSTKPAESVKAPQGKTICTATRSVCSTPLSCARECQVAKASQQAQRQQDWWSGQAQQRMHQAHEDLTKGVSAKLPPHALGSVTAVGGSGSLCNSELGRYMPLPAVNPLEMNSQTAEPKCATPLPDPEPKPSTAIVHCSGCKSHYRCLYDGVCRNEVRV